jgi:hypothetical protein
VFVINDDLQVNSFLFKYDPARIRKYPSRDVYLREVVNVGFKLSLKGNVIWMVF